MISILMMCFYSVHEAFILYCAALSDGPGATQFTESVGTPLSVEGRYPSAVASPIAFPGNANIVQVCNIITALTPAHWR